MSRVRAGAVQEMGTVLAVLALYVFTLLSPLHHAAGTQRNFAALGYAALTDWSVCVPLSEDNSHSGSQTLAVAKCAAAGIGKDALALPPFPVAIGAAERGAKPVAYPVRVTRRQPATPPHSGQARAPPVMI